MSLPVQVWSVQSLASRTPALVDETLSSTWSAKRVWETCRESAYKALST